ncbi:MAG: efflux RND transporter permease subunit [Dysgonamonadaceae bacterium]|jgi:multidrug efflux pump subunit AcrB|nr:efflux RND transporter permease subunit [Dysgonamonadaceae bacterium]
MKISSFSVILGFICFTLIGLALVPLLPVKLSPSQALPQINVSFNLQGNASRVVEMEVTSKLEAMLSRIKGVENIASTSGNGWGNIVIRFDKHVDVDVARFEVSTIIRQTWPHLPDGMTYPTISLNRSDENANRPFLVFTMNAVVNPIIIQQFTENQIKPQLAQIEGIDKIDISGAMPMEWRLEYDYKQLEILGLTVSDIQSAINNYLNREFMGTVVNRGKTDEWIRVVLVAGNTGENKFDPEKITVKNKEGKLITLNQIAKVAYLEQEAQSYYRINGLNSIYIAITSYENANQLDLSSRIKAKIEQIQSSFPSGYEIHIAYDATDYIQKELDKIYFRTGLTLLILLVFVLVIYRSFKYLLLIFLSLFMNIAAAAIFYYWGRLEMQLYSLAGITISLTLVIDNTIVMSDQIIRQGNKKSFLAILSATLTTIASLIIIFFMEEKIRLNLQDFAKVIIINLSVSLFIALFLVPALIDKLRVKNYELRVRKRKKILNSYLSTFNSFYASLCRFLWRWRVPTCILIVLLFGLPVFWLPDKLEGENILNKWYNKTLGSEFYKEKIKTHVDTYLGGTLRLFVQKVFEGSYFTDRQETSIYMTATLPNGATISQMNHLIQRMESYISQFSEVRQFETRIQSARRAEISIRFTKQGERSGFPYLLKSKLITKSLELGGGSWSVFGLGDGFSNDVRESAGSYRAILRGFNYDELSDLTEQFKKELLEHRRIKEVMIGSEFSWYKDDYQEFAFDLNQERLAQENIQPMQLFTSLRSIFGQKTYAGQISGQYGLERIVLYARQSQEYDIWSMEHFPSKIGEEKTYKLDELATLERTQMPQNIVKENQQYRLCLQYEYIGAYEQGRKVLENKMEEFRDKLPMGYSIEKGELWWDWRRDNGKQYFLLFIIFIIIYFTCSILFNSLKQPLSIIFVIPIAFIGTFLTFYLFKLNFDQGGFASFILLCGVSINANIYIINEYNNIRKRQENIPLLQAYIQAWGAKITPIFLTVISTVLGFIPFMIGENKEAFWFPLAAGTIGGIIMSLVGTFLFLPLFMGVAKPEKNRQA